MESFFKEIDVYHNTEDLIASGHLNTISQSQILLKGARKYNFEKRTNPNRIKHCFAKNKGKERRPRKFHLCDFT